MLVGATIGRPKRLGQNSDPTGGQWPPLQYHQEDSVGCIEPGRPNGLTAISGLTASNCQRPLAAESGGPNGLTAISGQTGPNCQRPLAAESGGPNGLTTISGLTASNCQRPLAAESGEPSGLTTAAGPTGSYCHRRLAGNALRKGGTGPSDTGNRKLKEGKGKRIGDLAAPLRRTFLIFVAVPVPRHRLFTFQISTADTNRAGPVV